MKSFFTCLLIFSILNSFCQQNEFHVQGQVVDTKQKPVSDAHIINFRNTNKYVSRNNGVFDAWVLPDDSLVITHISYFRKTISVYQLLQNPVIQLELDTINILPINVSPDQLTDRERAAENINSLEFDFRPQPGDSFTESERMRQLLNKENRVERTSASSLNYQFSPSEIIGKIAKKIEKRKKSKQFNSTKKQTDTK